jgi:cytoskeletal protein CcmA (bactofilin family)
MRRNLTLSVISIAAVVMLFSLAAVAQQSSDRVQFGRSIVVQPDEKAGDVVCVACSIRVRGRTAGDVVAVAGSVVLESGAQIAGDTVAVAGSVRLQSDAQVSGDVVAVAGEVHRDPQAVIHGDVTSMGGVGWIFLIFLFPLLLLGGIVALIIWIVQRSRRQAALPAYPGGMPSTRS